MARASCTTRWSAPAGTCREHSGARAGIEQARRTLMARHAIDADKAFAMLRDHSQHNGRKLADVAAAVVDSKLLLLPPDRAPAGNRKADLHQSRRGRR